MNNTRRDQSRCRVSAMSRAAFTCRAPLFQHNAVSIQHREINRNSGSWRPDNSCNSVHAISLSALSTCSRLLTMHLQLRWCYNRDFSESNEASRCPEEIVTDPTCPSVCGVCATLAGSKSPFRVLTRPHHLLLVPRAQHTAGACRRRQHTISFP